MGNLLLDSPAAAWLSIFGIYGAALLPVLLGNALALLWQKEQRKYAIVAMLFASLFIYFSPQSPQANGPEYRAALIQPNIPQDQKWDSRFLNKSMQSLAQLPKEDAVNVDVIIWPEAAVPFYIERSLNWSEWLQKQIDNWKTPLLFGSLKLFSDTGASQNGLYLSTPQNTHNKTQFVGKHHLVPFGEYIPSWLPWLRKIGPDIADFQPASDQGILSNKSTQFGSLICYESIFPGK